MDGGVGGFPANDRSGSHFRDSPPRPTSLPPGWNEPNVRSGISGVGYSAPRSQGPVMARVPPLPSSS